MSANPLRRCDARRLALTLGLSAAALGAGGAAQAMAQGADQRPGAVFSMTNNASGNSVTVFERRADGTRGRLVMTMGSPGGTWIIN